MKSCPPHPSSTLLKETGVKVHRNSIFCEELPEYLVFMKNMKKLIPNKNPVHFSSFSIITRLRAGKIFFQSWKRTNQSIHVKLEIRKIPYIIYLQIKFYFNPTKITPSMTLQKLLTLSPPPIDLELRFSNQSSASYSKVVWQLYQISASRRIYMQKWRTETRF